MKKLITLFSILFFVATTNGQNNLDIKKLEKDFVKVQRSNQKEGRSVYACKFELTNAQYNLFLEDLKKSGNTTLYTSCQRDSIGWKKFDFGHNDPYVKSYASHQVYNNYPVVCISFESALAYCEWLTAKYKASVNGKYKDVVFRLPSKGEWMAAADCKPQAPYPWYGSFPYSPKGCYYCNIRCDTINWIEDGAFYPVEKTSYFPNKLGLFNIIGNVAEMLSDKGIAKGGSWYNFPEEVDVRKVQRYESADPGVGVRVFMEVSEPSVNNSKQAYANQ
jgi:formylglycine-generating enzyme required for sulfatase activity